MEIEIQKHKNDILEIRPVGDLDTITASDFAEKLGQLIDAGARLVILSFNRINYVSSLGIGEIIQVWDRLRTSGGVMKFTGMSESVFKVFKLVGLTSRFEIYSTLDETLSSFNGITVNRRI
jgi:stage II sporulation protein AA (anti-sigma F factor antagonist)